MQGGPGAPSIARFTDVTSGAAVCVRTGLLKPPRGDFKGIERGRSFVSPFTTAEEANGGRSVAMTSPVICENELVPA